MYKFYYFDIKGLGEPARLMLTYSGAEWEDVRVTFPQWPELKPKMPNGQMPVLELPDGRQLPQIAAILRYVADSTGLTPADRWAAAETDALTAGLGDLLVAVYSVLATEEGAKQKATFQAKIDTVSKPAMGRLEARYAASKSGWFHSEISSADFIVYGSVLAHQHFFGTPNGTDHPSLMKLLERVEGLPQLKDHFAKYKDIIFSPMDPRKKILG